MSINEHPVAGAVDRQREQLIKHVGEYVIARDVRLTRVYARRTNTRTSRTDDYVTSVTRIEGGRAVICNVTLQKSRERGGESTDLGRGSLSLSPALALLTVLAASSRAASVLN